MMISGKYGVVEEKLMLGGASHWVVVAEFAPFQTKQDALAAMNRLAEVVNFWTTGPDDECPDKAAIQ